MHTTDRYNTYEYLMMRSGYGWLASAATNCVTATWELLLIAGDDDDSWVPTGTMSADGGDSGLSGKITNVKLDFVGTAVLGIICSTSHKQLSECNSKYLKAHLKQGVALTVRNTTGPQCSRKAIIRLEAAWRRRLACAAKATCRPDVECYRRRQQTTTTTDALDCY